MSWERPNPFFPHDAGSYITGNVKQSAAAPSGCFRSPQPQAHNNPGGWFSSPHKGDALPDGGGAPSVKRLPFSAKLREVEAALSSLALKEHERPARTPSRVMSLCERKAIGQHSKKMMGKLQAIGQDGWFSTCAQIAGFHLDTSQAVRRVHPIRDWRPELSLSAPSAQELLLRSLDKTAASRKAAAAAETSASLSRLANNKQALKDRRTPHAELAVAVQAQQNTCLLQHHLKVQSGVVDRRVQHRAAGVLAVEAAARRDAATKRAEDATYRRQMAGLGRIKYVIKSVFDNNSTFGAVVIWKVQTVAYRILIRLMFATMGARVQLVARWTIQEWRKGSQGQQTWLKQMEAKALAEEKARREEQVVGLGDRLFGCLQKLTPFSQLPVAENHKCVSPVLLRAAVRRATYVKSRWEQPHLI